MANFGKCGHFGNYHTTANGECPEKIVEDLIKEKTKPCDCAESLGLRKQVAYLKNLVKALQDKNDELQSRNDELEKGLEEISQKHDKIQALQDSLKRYHKSDGCGVYKFLEENYSELGEI